MLRGPTFLFFVLCLTSSLLAEEREALFKKPLGKFADLVAKHESKDPKGDPQKDPTDEGKGAEGLDSELTKQEREQEEEKTRAWNITQDKKTYEYRVNQMTPFLGSHGAAAPLYNPSAGNAPEIAPFVSAEFKDAQGNLWTVVEGSPEKMLDLFSEDKNNSIVPATEETPVRDTNSVSAKEEGTPVREFRAGTITYRSLLSANSPTGTASASTTIGPQSNSFNIFMSNSIATNPNILPVTANSRETASIEKLAEKGQEKNETKPRATIQEVTINNNLSVEGATVDNTSGTELGSRTLKMLQKTLASTKSEPKGAPTSWSQKANVGRLSMEASYGSRGIASLADKSARGLTWGWISMLLVAMVAGAVELHRRKITLLLARKIKEAWKTRTAAASISPADHSSERTFATSATRIFRQ